MSTALPGVKYRRKKADTLNQLVFNDYLTRLIQLAMSRFEWSGLPESINIRYMEQTLMNQGMAGFYKNQSVGFLCLPVVQRGKLNMYEEPTAWNTVNPVFHDDLEENGSWVIIYDTITHDRTIDTLMLFAERLANVERTLDVNVGAQKTPVLIVCTEQQRLTLENVYISYVGNQPVIFADDQVINKDTLKVLKTDAPYLCDKLMIYKHNIWNEALTFLGLNNVNTDKKERLITDEAQANNQLIMMSAESALRARENACKEINQLFGLAVSVKLKQQALPEGSEDEGGKEGKADG